MICINKGDTVFCVGVVVVVLEVIKFFCHALINGSVDTCTYFFDKNGSTQNARFAVIARLVRDGESEAIDESLVKANDNVRYPQLYYDVYGGTNPWANGSKWVPYSE